MLVALLANPTWACSMVGPDPFAVDSAIEDDLPPAPPVRVGVDLQRGVGPRRSGLFGRETTSCDDIGGVWIEVARPAGDPDPADEVGYRLEQLDGTLPDGLEVPSGPWRGPTLSLTWIDDATDDQEPFAFTLAIVPVDRAGNEGPALELELADDGSVPGGCASAPWAGGLGWLAPLALLRRRR